MLRVLGEHGAVETGRVAREAFILGPSLTGVLARMERDELITRSRDPDDQRRTVVEATAQGRELVEDAVHQHRGALRTGWKRRWARRSSRSSMRCSTNSSHWSNHELSPTGTVYGALLNFRAELDALAPQMNQPPYKAPPKAPVLYVKTANTWSPHGSRDHGAGKGRCGRGRRHRRAW